MNYPSGLKRHKRKKRLLQILPIAMATIFISIVVFFLRDIKPNNYSNIPKNSIGEFIRKPDGSSVVSFARLKAEQLPENSTLAQNIFTPQNMNTSTGTNTLPISSIDFTTSEFKSEPDYNLDFSSMGAGTLVSSMFRIQNGIDDDWNPSWNGERQMYTPKNVLIKDGNLVMYAKVESDGQITSGKVDTNGLFSATYGKFEIEAKLPTGVGTFPAIWLLPVDSAYFRNNIATPAENSSDLSWQGGGEIDVMEFLGILPDSIFHDVHTYNSLITNSKAASSETQINSVSNDYHTYGIEWTPSYIAFTVDGIRTHAVAKTSSDFRDWPFDKPFYLIFNLAMGGTWNDQAVIDAGQSFPNGIDNSNQANWVLSIKSVKHFALAN